MHALVIANTDIRQDADGLYSLNDLHKASGGDKKHQPANFMRLDTTTALVAEIDNSSDVRSFQATEGRNGGTFVCKELVYAYAMWISPAFHLKVIRAYDAMATGQIEVSQQAVIAAAIKQLKSVIHEEVLVAGQVMVPALVHGYLASQQTILRHGQTAGQIWDSFGLPKIKNGAVMLSNRLELCGCLVEGGGRAEMGGRTSKLFDPDKSAKVMKSGLLEFCQRYVKERQGQGNLFALKPI